jgi:hypothetical protein
VGVVQYPQDGDALQLLYRAASALLGQEDAGGDSD